MKFSIFKKSLATFSQISNNYNNIISGSTVSPWTPSQISTRFWYDASDTSSITSTGNTITQVNDKSGNGYALTVASGQSAPFTGTRTLNGLNVIEYTGNNCLENLSFSHDQASTPLNIAIVSQVDTPAAAQHFLVSGTLNTTVGTRMSTRWINNAFGIIGGSGGSNITFSSNTVSPAGQPYLIVPKFNSNNSTWRVDGSLTNTGNIGTNAYTRLELGHNEDEGSDLDGFFAEVVGFTAVADITIVEGYLAWKWGLESNLPPSHPYKNNRPVI